MTRPPHRTRANTCTTAKYCPPLAWQGRGPFPSNDPWPIWRKHRLHNMHQTLPQATQEKNYGLVCFSWLRHPGKGLQRLSFHLHSTGRATPQCRQWLSSRKQHGPSTHTLSSCLKRSLTLLETSSHWNTELASGTCSILFSTKALQYSC